MDQEAVISMSLGMNRVYIGDEPEGRLRAAGSEDLPCLKRTERRQLGRPANRLRCMREDIVGIGIAWMRQRFVAGRIPGLQTGSRRIDACRLRAYADPNVSLSKQ